MADIDVTIGDETINVTVDGNITQRITYLNEDEQLLFDGASGDSYMTYNSTTNKIELWVGGVKQAEWG